MATHSVEVVEGLILLMNSGSAVISVKSGTMANV